jgi:membrane-associated phospholipid phosphatase
MLPALNTRRTSFAAVSALVALVASSVPARAADPDGAPRLGENQHFTIDPVVDGVLVVGGAGFAGLLGLVLSTGEIRPQAPGRSDNLLEIDESAITQKIDPRAGTLSNLGLATAIGYAILDPLLSGVRDGRRALLVDAIIYAEAISLTQAFTGLTKAGVRRPRPIDYVNCSPTAVNPSVDCSSTDLQLSFFSGHAATTSTIAATATYLAFARSGPRAARPWLTLAGGTLLTAFVSFERVRSGQHFPTDVIMGSLAGAAIGVLVPHFHRRPHYHDDALEHAPLWIGYAPTSTGGGAVQVGWTF